MPKIIDDIEPITPFWTTADGKSVKLYLGNVIDVLKRLPEKSVHMCVTSPPYWGLRDYGTGTWKGGDPKCDHLQPHGVPLAERPSGDHNVGKGGSTHEAQELRQYTNKCGKCGARREDFQIGSEMSPDCGIATSAYVELRDDLTPKERDYVLSELRRLRLW